MVIELDVKLSKELLELIRALDKQGIKNAEAEGSISGLPWPLKGKHAFRLRLRL